MVPTYATKDNVCGIRFVEFFKTTVYPSLENLSLTKRGLASAFEQLLFLHGYVHTLFETSAMEDFELVVQTALPPLVTLDNILRKCADISKIRENCSKESDLETALLYARLTSFQALKLLWF